MRIFTSDQLMRILSARVRIETPGIPAAKLKSKMDVRFVHECLSQFYSFCFNKRSSQNRILIVGECDGLYMLSPGSGTI